MDLSPLTPDDIAEVMRIERLPGYDAFVGRWAADEHAAQMADAAVAYYGVRAAAGGLDGFVILQELDQPTILLRRVAVGAVQGGVGTRIVRAVLDWAFTEHGAEAVRLDVALGNPRAQHVYAREGFETYASDDTHHFMRIPRARRADVRGG